MCQEDRDTDTHPVAKFIYIDETGSSGKGARKQRLLTVVGVIVDEDKVQPLAEALRDVAMRHLGWYPRGFEFHGVEVWGGGGLWKGKSYDDLIAAYEAVIDLLATLDLDVAHASIDKPNLRKRYSGAADDNAYRLALQFLLEKIDATGSSRKVLVADEAKEQQLAAINMVKDMQDWGGGEVPGRTLRTVIDSLHFVQSHASPGVQMADMVAYMLWRAEYNREGHPNATAAVARLRAAIDAATLTWREAWPR